MNILVIGNGFDLAHELPTKYGDFLEWIVDQLYYYDYLSEQGAEITKGVSRPNLFVPKSKLRETKSSRSVKQREIWECMDDNFWLEYFLNSYSAQKENWIDFESEIKKIIQLLDFDLYDEQRELDDDINKSSSKFFNNVYIKRAIEMSASSIITYRQIRDKLRIDLNKLIRVLEIYLSEFVNSQKCNKSLPNIEKILKYPFENADGSIEDKISYIISFNYTNTYERIYFKNENIEKYIHYIHGKADINHKVEDNNMVLGIDEFLPDYRKDKDIQFIAFKKFYQRICKATGSKYKEWVDEIQSDYRINNDAENNCIEMIKCALRENDMEKALKWHKSAHENYTKKTKKHNLYIFGHSLDVTDKDILKDLILNDNVDTTIFYRNQEQKEQQVANLVKVIGPDELIRRTGGHTRSIFFELQEKPRDIEN